MKSSPGNASSLSNSIHQQLNGYGLAAGAAGVALLALAQPSEAKIVYTPAHEKLPLNKDFFLDLNHDRTTDFRLHILTSDADCAARRATCSSGDAAFFFEYPQVKGNAVVGRTRLCFCAARGCRDWTEGSLQLKPRNYGGS